MNTTTTIAQPLSPSEPIESRIGRLAEALAPALAGMGLPTDEESALDSIPQLLEAGSFCGYDQDLAADFVALVAELG